MHVACAQAVAGRHAHAPDPHPPPRAPQASSFWQFLLLRLLTGVAGGVFPLIYSLLGDLFPSSQRAAMASLVQVATGLGIGGGQLVAGMLGPATNWRLPFVVVAAPAIALALLMLATVVEPPRCVCVGRGGKGVNVGRGGGARSCSAAPAGRARRALRQRQSLPAPCLQWRI